MRDIGGGCGQAAMRVFELMNEKQIKWISGKQRGQNIRVMFTMPIKFKAPEPKPKLPLDTLKQHR